MSPNKPIYLLNGQHSLQGLWLHNIKW